MENYHYRTCLFSTVMVIAFASPSMVGAQPGPIRYRVETSCLTQLVFFGLTDLCVLACVVFDNIRHRRLHPAFLWGTIFIVASQPLRLMLGGTDIWDEI